MSTLMMRILGVDDEKSIRQMVTQVLVDEGYGVAQAASGEEALKAFRDKPFSLVMTDVRMGGMSGLELPEEIKRLNPEALVVIMTAYASLDSAITALKAGAYDYIIKPFEDLELVTNVARRATENISAPYMTVTYRSSSLMWTSSRNITTSSGTSMETRYSKKLARSLRTIFAKRMSLRAMAARSS